MSDLGAILDKYVAAGQAAVSDLVGERGLRRAEDVSPSDFPHLFVYDADESVELLPFLLERVTTETALLLVTDGETQEAALLKADAIKAKIDADRTLGGLVQWCRVSTRQLREDARDKLKAVHMLVETVEATGRIFRADLAVQMKMSPTVSDFAPVATAIGAFLAIHMTGWARCTGSDYITDRDSLASGEKKYQLRFAPVHILYDRTDVSQLELDIQLSFFYHVPKGTDESAWLESTFFPKIDGLLSGENWRALTVFTEVTAQPTLTLEGDAGRQEG